MKPNHEMLLSDLLAEYRAHNAATVGPRTMRLYYIAGASYSKALGRPATVGDLTDKAMGQFITYRQSLRDRRGKPLSPATIEYECAKLMSVWRWAAARGWCEAPTMRIRRSKPHTPDAWKPDELKRLYAAFDKIPKANGINYRIGGVPTCLVMPALIGLALDTGERFEALKMVKWSDFNGRFVNFRAETRKGGKNAGDNPQKVTRRTAKALAALRRENVGSELVFPQIANTTYLHHYGQVLKWAGLPNERRCKFHKLRRTHASYVHLAGGDATAALGHSSDAVTRAYYLDPTICQRGYGSDLMEGSLSRLFGRLRGAFGF